MGIIKRQGLKSSILNYIGVGLGAIFFLLVFPQILDKQYLGFYQLILSATMVFVQLPVLGTSNILYKYFEQLKRENRISSFNAFAIIAIIIGCSLFTLLYFLFQDLVIAFYYKKSPLFSHYYYILPPLVFIMAISHYLDHFAMMKLRVAVPTFIREILSRVLVIVTLFLLAFHVLTESQFVIFYIIAYAISLVSLIYYARKFLDFKFSKPTAYIKKNNSLKAQFRYGYSAMAVNFTTTLQNFADAIMLPAYLGLGALGVYGRPLILGQMISIPYRSIAYIASPIIMQAWYDNDIHKIESLNKKLSVNLLLIGLFLFAIVIVNADNFYRLLPPTYAEGKNVLYIIAFGRLIDMSFGLNSEILFSSKYYRWVVWFTAITLLATIGLNILFIPIMGMEGAAFSVTISLILFNVLKNMLIYRTFGFHCFSAAYVRLILIAIVSISITILIPDLELNVLNQTFQTPIASVLLNVCSKTLLLSILFIAPVLLLRINPDFNDFIRLIITGKIFKGGHKMEEL